MGCSVDFEEKKKKKGRDILPVPHLLNLHPRPNSPTHVLHPPPQGESSELTAFGRVTVRTEGSPGHRYIPQFPRENQRALHSEGGAPGGGASASGSVGSSRACARIQTCGAGIGFTGTRRSRLLLPGQSHGGGKFKPCQPRGVL